MAHLRMGHSYRRASLLPFDHIYQGITGPVKDSIILYSDLFDGRSLSFHSFLLTWSDSKSGHQYVFRHRTPIVIDSTPMHLSGYGVELAIKNTEYKVIDDRKIQGASISMH